LKAAITLFEGCPLDGYDIFYVNAMRNAGIDAVLTDDIDFIYVPGLRVFTANERALKLAAMYKKVSTRGNGGGDLNPWRRPRIEPLSA
jgi:hypothetical protein